MTKKRHVMAILFSFFITFFLSLGIVVFITHSTVMDQNYLFHIMDESNYYQSIANALNNDFKNSAGAAGFYPDIYNDFVTTQDVKNVSSTYIHDYFDKGEAKVETQDFQEKLDRYLHDIAEEGKMDLTEKDEERLEKYVEVNVKCYQQYLSFPFLKYFIMLFDMMDKVTTFLLGACTLIVAIGFFFLIKLKMNYQNLSLYLSSIMFGSGFILGIPSSFVLLGQYLRKINLTPEFYYRFIVLYLEKYVYIILLISLMFIVLGILVLCFYSRKIHRHLNSAKDTL